MSDESAESQQNEMAGGSYEIIRRRLDRASESLQSKLDALNQDRREIFGAVEPALVATERVATAHNCTARDMAAIGANRFLFAYNVQLGLKSTTDPEDVFAAYEYDPETHVFNNVPLNEIFGENSFQDDFHYVYRFYRNSSFSKIHRSPPHIFLVLQAGRDVTDVKTFKWLVKGDGTLEYLGNRFDHEFQYPPQHDFEWKRAHRDMQRTGQHPHLSIEDRLFVETIGGDLTIKIENNTSSGQGIYSEPVDNHDQTLDDAEILYAIVGSLILLKILPYQEQHHRYLVYNEKTGRVHRLDRIADSCVLLPDDQGLIFPNGYLLQTGEVKTFDTSDTDMRFERRVISGNGEDTLYIFHNLATGRYVLLPYNRIEQKVENLIACGGYALFPNGELLYFRDSPEPQRHHAIQIWRTPYVAADQADGGASDPNHFLAKLGNAELVRCMSECREILTLLQKEDSYGDLYVDLVKLTGDIADAYWWLDREEAHDLKSAITEIHTAATGAIDEFEKVRALRQTAAQRLSGAEERATAAIREAATAPQGIESFVSRLAELRATRGEILSLREVRYVEEDQIEALDEKAAEALDKLSRQTVEFLLEPESLEPYRARLRDQSSRTPKVSKVAEARELEEEFNETGADLEMLIEIIGNLKIEDSTQTTRILDEVSGIYANLNQARIELRNRRRDLAREEGAAEFHAQVRLLSQSVTNYLDLCQTPEQCEEYLNRLMVQLEELEGRFSEFDEYLEELAGKREEVYSSFDNRRQALLDQRQKRADTLLRSGERILTGIEHRLGSFNTIAEINGYLASDLMASRLRDLVKELNKLGDPVKAGDLQTRLRTLEQEAVRQLRDRSELFADGVDVLQLGRHKFRVNRQELELSFILRDSKPGFHLAGTNYFESITDESFLQYRDLWEQEVISENTEVYRAEYLAVRILQAMEAGGFPGNFAELDEEERTAAVQQFMAPRYAEAFTRGVHDHDARLILDALLPMREALGLLRYSVEARAFALLFWEADKSREGHRALELRLRSMGDASRSGADGQSLGNPLRNLVIKELRDALHAFGEAVRDRLPFPPRPDDAAAYLFEELSGGPDFSVSHEAAELAQSFRHHLVLHHLEDKFRSAVEELRSEPVAAYQLLLDALVAFARRPDAPAEAADFAPETAAHLLPGYELRNAAPIALENELTGLKGAHAVVDSSNNGRYHLHYTRFNERLDRFVRETVPRYEAYTALRSEMIGKRRETLRPEQFRATVMTSFVRNRLINEVYLPLIGDNLAKQLGTAGDDTRTDRSGLLLLVSPPGYGKTTLLEYVASRLGLVLVKINGPAIGNRVTSLDPAEAPNASAREEIEKLNLALEMGDNLMLCIDDIQHCDAEFLQKFISLCDAQRRIEGVWRGQARTYDFRGRRVGVVMMGNPYTETGGKFQIPDMLANRADTYNLGDIAGGHDDAFKASYIENALTSNSTLTRLSARSQKDVYAVMQIARTDSQEGVDFEGNYSPAEIDEMVRVMKHLFTVRDTILRVNLEYIRSAAQADEYRTEPPFRLQGSYRNMNRIAERILPLMTPEEVREVIDAHYENEAQTLTSGAESNLLKFKELEGTQTEKESERWDEIRRTFRRNLLAGGGGENDPVSRVVGQLSGFQKGLEDIQLAVVEAAKTHAQPQTIAEQTIEQLEKIIKSLRSVPVDVQIKVVPVESSEVQEPSAPAKKLKKTAKEPSDLPVKIESKVEQG